MSLFRTYARRVRGRLGGHRQGGGLGNIKTSIAIRPPATDTRAHERVHEQNDSKYTFQECGIGGTGARHTFGVCVRSAWKRSGKNEKRVVDDVRGRAMLVAFVIDVSLTCERNRQTKRTFVGGRSEPYSGGGGGRGCFGRQYCLCDVAFGCIFPRHLRG